MQRVLQPGALRTSAILVLASAATLALAGCGNQYRPVVSAISPVGPAGQPTKYAVAVSSPSATAPGLVTFVDFSGDTVLSTPSILANTSYFALNNTGTEGFVINAAGSLNDFPTSNPTALITSEIVQTTLPAGSAPYSVSAITPFNGTASIFVPQTNTSSIAVFNTATTSLLQQLTVGTNPVYVVGADSTPRVYAISQGAAGGNGQVAAIEATSTSSLSISATLAVGKTPVYGVMTADDKRAFILNKGSGSVSVINVINNALDSTTPTITLPTITYTGGTATPNPVWADISPTTDQLVILNQGNSLASTSALTYGGTYAAGTTYAQNAVVSYQGGTYVDNSAAATPAGTLPTNTAFFTQLHPGSLSLIDIPLCSSITQITNPNCNSANPTDATTFGTITSSANVGINPVMVSVLHDGTAAYVANQFDSTGTCTAGEGSVSVVNLVTGVVTATLCGVSGSTATVSQNGVYSFPSLVYGHPNTISATTGTPTGKVYVTSSDSQYMSIIYTNTNTVSQHVNLQGNGVRVLMTNP